MDDVKKFNLSITKIEEEQERNNEKVQIIPLSSPMKVRSPLGYRSSYNLSSETQPSNILNLVSSKIPLPLSNQTATRPDSTIQTSSNKEVQTIATSQENLRKPSILSLRSLSLSLRLLMPTRVHRESEEHIEPLKTIEETKMATFKDSEFHSYSKHSQLTQQQQQQQPSKSRRFTIFKNQKIYDRRSSMSDIPDDSNNVNQRNLQSQRASSSSTSNVKHEHYSKKHVEHKHQKSQDKTAETLKEVRRRNLETAKRLQSAPRRISTAY